ncbi:RhuM family protein [Aliarcobacter butzleri]|uniref:DNA-binding protein n=2 Tax=Arcobacteraceae TaxID=2808963 RepID=A0A837J5T3_9BACT|nr:RhuM family protein [Aliarcobacter butzleri]KLE01141.1 DNA-binding protein [Aliarcobacter butzleri L351]KLE13735.1 DNA-binding protein [Aliarcobacter butzleri L350]MDN5048280.1 RhuM family protein [Aliarcobacter butzleri]MDN5059944.1 RhuM family protein [Aliarcobacter butzleri]MDN5110499.1 RhuM family protein [Aliarcobacter butzleri]
MNDLSNLVVYNDGELELKVSVNSETIWLTQKQISELFMVTVPNINMHIKAIYKDEELIKNRTIQNFLIVQKEGNREVERNVEHYNLDMIISIGYRVNSVKATKFRQWATSILKNYIQNGYVINGEKITNERFVNLENDVNSLKNQINEVKSKIKENKLETSQGIFFDGQIFDSYSFINDLLKLAQKEVILVDNYIDDTVFTLFSKYPNINFIIYTNSINNQLKLDFEKYSKQYKNISLKTFKDCHDRFLILDKKEIYHLGASLKDLGKKWFAFSKMNLKINEIINRLE